MEEVARMYDTGIVVTDEGLLPGATGAAGLGEMAKLFKVTQATTYQWQARELLPEPDDEISGRNVWFVTTLVLWGQQTGRPCYLHPQALQRLGVRSQRRSA